MRAIEKIAKPRGKSALCLASAVAVGVALADYATPVRVTVSAGNCCQTSWDCHQITYCVWEQNCNFTGQFFGQCQS